MAERSSRGQYAPGTSGNPRGRPIGTASTNAARKALQEHGPELIEALITKALKGDTPALVACIERLAPRLKPQSEPVSIDIPEDASLSEISKAWAHAAARGELSADQAAQMTSAIASVARVIELSELDERLAAVETALTSNNKDHHA